jgi:primosomal replication protein N
VNRFVLSGCIVELGALRYTPAGIPAQDLRVEHESSVTEAGQLRQIKAAVRAIALGSVAERLGRQALGSRWQFTGFLANIRQGKSLVLHIQDFQQDSFQEGPNGHVQEVQQG